jgi:lysophospholipase L1-like esterase
MWQSFLTLALLLSLGVDAGTAGARDLPSVWVATWAASPQGPYASGNASAQPSLKFAFPDPAEGAVDQTFRLIVKPDLWGADARFRFSNTFGTKPVTLDDLHVGLQTTGGNVLDGSNRPITFNEGQHRVVLAPGQTLYSDLVHLPFLRTDGFSGDLLSPIGRKLAVSFHVVGASGPMTWHAKALTTSYVTAPHAGAHGGDDNDAAFPYSTTSWYFLDAVDVTASQGTMVVVAFGDSITDGTASTLNGDDRWPDVLSRRMHAAYGSRVSVVNEGIGGNMVIGPNPESPFAGGPPAVERLDRDVLTLSGLSAVIWLEGINDFGRAGASSDAVIAAMRDVVKRIRAHGNVKIVMATLTSSLKSTIGNYGAPEVDQKRRALNDFIRSAGIFDGIADFDAVTVDKNTGTLKAEFIPESTTGGPGDLLHPNRAGYQAMGETIDIRLLQPPPTPE